VKAYYQLLSEIESGKIAPLYFLFGDEPFYIDQLTSALDKHVLTEQEKAFNQISMYGKETDAKQVLDQVQRYPVMANRQLVFLKEAQAMRQFGDLSEYFSKPAQSTVLVITYKNKKPDKRTRFYKALKKGGVVFESKKLYENQVPAWIDDFVKSKKRTITPDALRLVAEYLGTDLQKISNELDKLLLRLGDQDKIDLNAVEESIGISREYNVFELQRAIGMRDVVKAQHITDQMRRNMRPHPLLMICASLFNYFQKIYLLKGAKNMRRTDQVKLLGLRNDYFLQEYDQAAGRFSIAQLENVITLLRTYDLRSKGVENAHIPESELFREMVFRLLTA
jgi:DNA polymerase-3 subunit delta